MKFLGTSFALFLSSIAKAQMSPQGTGFSLQLALDVDNTLDGNTDIIGAHIHSGSATVNGPVNIIFCGSAPLPSNNGQCVLSNVVENGNRTTSLLDVPSSLGAWSNGVNNATAVPGATTLEEGAPTTYESFLDTLLNDCSSQSESCPLYLNFHTIYSFAENPGYGLARSQLREVNCPPYVTQDNQDAHCFGTDGNGLSSINTNMVTDLPNPLPPDAGKATQVRSSPIVVYVPPVESGDSTPPSSLRGVSDDSPTMVPTSGASAIGKWSGTAQVLSAISGAAFLLMGIMIG